MAKKRGFLQKNTHLKPFSAKIVVFGIVMLTLISMVSALEFDNVKNVKQTHGYSEKYKDIEIINAFDLPLLRKTLWSGSLKENTDACGINCEAQTDITLYETGSLVDEIIFKTLQEDGSWIEQPIRSYKINYWGEIDDYETECKDNDYSSSGDCKQVKVGSHEGWIEYILGTELPAGEYTLKLEGEKKPTRTVDWIYKTQGETLNEWAEWGGAYLQYVLDDFADSSINTSHWTLTSTGGSSWSEGAGYVTNGGGWADPAIATMTSNKTNFNSATGIVSANVSFQASIQGTGSQFGSDTTASVIFVDESANEVTVWSKVEGWGFPLTYYNLSFFFNATDENNLIVTEDGSPTNVDITSLDDADEWYIKLKTSDPASGPEADITARFYAMNYTELGEAWITLNFPSNNYISPTNEVEFNATATVTGGATLTNISLWHNGTGTWERNQTKSYDAKENYTGVADTSVTVGAGGVHYLWQTFTAEESGWMNKISLNATSNGGSVTVEIQGVALNGQPNGTILSTNTTTGLGYTASWFNYSMPPIYLTEGEQYAIVGDSLGLYKWYDTSGGNPYTGGQLGYDTDNVTYVLADALFEVFYNSTLTSITQTFNTIIINPTLWGIQACDSDGDCGFSTENRTVSVDTVAPTITINLPTTLLDYGVAGENETLNWTVSDSNLDSMWYNYNGTNVSVYGTSNETEFQLDGTDRNLTFWANDSVANVNSLYRAWNYTIWVLGESHSDPIPEGSEQTFSINVTSGQASTTPSLVYNGTSYLGTCTQSGSNFYCSIDLDIPPVSADTNVTFYWSFLMGDASVVNGTSTNTTVTNFAMDNCTTNTVEIMNLLLKEEEGNTLWAGNYSNIEVEVDIYSLNGILIGEYNKQWTNESNVSICVGNLTGANYNLFTTIGFDIDNYVNEFYFIDKKQINTTVVPININLMDLLATDSTSFLFNYFDEDGLSVSDPIIHVWRKYIGEGLFREVERSKQNDDGNTIVHLVEEDVIYYFQVSQDNTVIFTSDTYTALCDSAPCTITLEASGGYQEFEDDWDLVDNGAYSISSSAITRTVNLTFATTTPSTFNLTVYKLDSEGEYEYVGSDEVTGTSGTLDVVVPAISGNVSFFSVVRQDGDYKASYWNDFTAPAREYFGNGFAVFLGLLIIMCLGLMGISEGSGTVVLVILGLFLTIILGLIDYGLGNEDGIGIGLLIYFIVTGGIIIWKLTRRNR